MAGSMIPKEASVKIILDPSAAKRETESFKRELVKLDEAKKKAQDEIKAFIEGTARVVGGADPNDPDGKRGKPSSDRPNDQGADLEKPARRVGILDTIDSILSVAKTAFQVTKNASTITAVLAEATKGTWVEEVTQYIDDKVKAMAEKVIDLESKLVLRETAVDVVDYHIASLKLGGKVPTGDDEQKIIEEYWRIHSSQADLTKSLALEKERQLAQTVVKAVQASYGR